MRPMRTVVQGSDVYLEAKRVKDGVPVPMVGTTVTCTLRRIETEDGQKLDPAVSDQITLVASDLDFATGRYALMASNATTENWPLGIYAGRVQFVKDGFKRSTKTLYLSVERSYK